MYWESRSSSALAWVGVGGLAAGGTAEALEVEALWAGTETAGGAGGRLSGWRYPASESSLPPWKVSSSHCTVTT